MLDLMKMKNEEITLTDNGTALDRASGFEYDIHSFDYAGKEAITIPALDLISYDEGETCGMMD